MVIRQVGDWEYFYCVTYFEAYLTSPGQNQIFSGYIKGLRQQQNVIYLSRSLVACRVDGYVVAYLPDA